MVSVWITSNIEFALACNSVQPCSDLQCPRVSPGFGSWGLMPLWLLPTSLRPPSELCHEQWCRANYMLLCCEPLDYWKLEAKRLKKSTDIYSFLFLTQQLRYDIVWYRYGFLLASPGAWSRFRPQWRQNLDAGGNLNEFCRRTEKWCSIVRSFQDKDWLKQTKTQGKEMTCCWIHLNPNIFPIWVFENIILMSFLMAEKMEDEHSKSLWSMRLGPLHRIGQVDATTFRTRSCLSWDVTVTFPT